MKKMMVALCGVLFSPGLFAQEDNVELFANKTFIGGVVAGLNASQVDGDNYSGYRKAGLNAGAMVYVNFAKRAGVSLELLFAQKGAVGVRGNSNGQVGSYFEHYKMKLNYAEVPLVFHFYQTPNLHFNLGASYSALISSKETHDDPFSITTFDESLYPYKKYEIDGIIGVSYVWKHFLLDARFQYGLTPLREANNAPAVAANGRNQVVNMLSFRIGYFFF